MSVHPLQSSTPITIKGDMPSPALVQIIQQMARIINQQQLDIAALTALVAALTP